MILYYRIQIKEDGIWQNDETHSPVAVKQEQVRALIGLIRLANNERLIRISQSEAINSSPMGILFIEFSINSSWHAKLLTIEKD